MTYTKEELIEPLKEAAAEDGPIYDVLNARTNDYPTFPTYSKYFGSMDAAFEEAGIEREKYVSRDVGHDFDIAGALESADGFDPDADGYVYVVRFERQCDDKEFIYVGSTEQKLYHRLSVHRSADGSFAAPTIIDGASVKVGRHKHTMHFTGIEEIRSYDHGDFGLDEQLFGGAVDRQESIIFGEMVQVYDPTMVIGGN